MSEPEGPATDRPDAVGPVDPLKVPRFAGPSTFARLPRRDEVDRCDVAVVVFPSTAASRTAGARFDRTRFATRRAAPLHHPGRHGAPVAEQQVADAGDIACNPFDIEASPR
jgi:agmatinase